MSVETGVKSYANTAGSARNEEVIIDAICMHRNYKSRNKSERATRAERQNTLLLLTYCMLRLRLSCHLQATREPAGCLLTFARILAERGPFLVQGPKKDPYIA